jgi:hypothetical protein
MFKTGTVHFLQLNMGEDQLIQHLTGDLLQSMIPILCIIFWKDGGQIVVFAYMKQGCLAFMSKFQHWVAVKIYQIKKILGM